MDNSGTHGGSIKVYDTTLAERRPRLERAPPNIDRDALDQRKAFHVAWRSGESRKQRLYYRVARLLPARLEKAIYSTIVRRSLRRLERLEQRMSIVLRSFPPRLAPVKQWLRSLPPRKSRRFHAYCVGDAKTGTHSVHGIFATHFRSAHEPEREALVALLELEERSSLNHDEKVDFLLKRDRRLNLEMDASAFNRRFVSLYAELFPESKFIMTIRDPYTRTDSLINHMLNNPTTSELAQRRKDLIFRADQYSHVPEEEVLRERGLHTLDGFLADYAETNASIAGSIPADRLLVVRTDYLGESVTAIARFLDVPEELLDLEKSHTYQARKKYGILANMDPGFVDAKVRAHCADLLADSFPEIQSIHDVMPKLQPSE